MNVIQSVAAPISKFTSKYNFSLFRLPDPNTNNQSLIMKNCKPNEENQVIV